MDLFGVGYEPPMEKGTQCYAKTIVRCLQEVFYSSNLIHDNQVDVIKDDAIAS